MSQEFENQIKESVLNDKINLFWKKYRFSILISGILIVATFVAYFSYEVFNKKKNSQELHEYSIAIEKLKNQDVEQSKKVFKKLIHSSNDNLVLLSLNQLLIASTHSKDEMIEYINIVLAQKKLKNANIELIKIKKAIIMFDIVNEKEIRELLDIKNKNSSFAKIQQSLLNDFINSKNKTKKVDIKNKLNEK